MPPSQLIAKTPNAKRLKTTAAPLTAAHTTHSVTHARQSSTLKPAVHSTKVTPAATVATAPTFDKTAQALAWLLRERSLTDIRSFNQSELQEALSDAVIDQALLNTIKSDDFAVAYQAIHPNLPQEPAFDPTQNLAKYAVQANLSTQQLHQSLKVKAVCNSQLKASSSTSQAHVHASRVSLTTQKSVKNPSNIG